MNKERKYSIGLDIGTTSVGWAIIDNNTFKLVKKGNKRQSMWGVRLFDEAQKAAERRAKRGTRRRYERRRERIKLLQEIFSKEIEKVDEDFYQKLKDSFYAPDDSNNPKKVLTEFDKVNIFGNNKREKIIEKEYPTIYHIRNKIINSEQKEDIRLIYLAIHHIIKYRGNFLYNNDNFNIKSLNIKNKLKDVFEEINSLCEIPFNIEEITDKFYSDLEQAILEKSITDRKIKIKELLNNYFDKNFVGEFTKLIVGNQFSLSKLFNIDLEEEIKLSFKKAEYDENYLTYEKVLNDKISVLDLLKELYDMIFLKNIFGDNTETSISSLMIAKYNKHKKDLKSLKRILRLNKKTFKEFFKDKRKDTEKEKLCLYTKYINNKITYDSFIKEINKALQSINLPLDLNEEYNKIKLDIEMDNFLPRITDTANGKYPYQLNKYELIKIIESQGKYYSFLNDKIIVNGKEKYKLEQLLEFRIPYYVGPLNTKTSEKGIDNKNAWLVKKDDSIKITPFNFDKVVDKEKTAEQFIARMISNCTYLLNEKAIPANSILYSKYKVLNELKQIKINGIKLSVEMQQRIYNELFLTTNKKITEKVFIDYLRKTKEYNMYNKQFLVEGYSDNKKFANSMNTYYDFFGEDGIFTNTDYNIDGAEEIIEWITIFEDKDILESKVRRKYPKLSGNQVKQIVSKRYKGWSNLSKKLLTKIIYMDKVTHNPKSIMDLMWETSENFMQIIFNKEYKFQDKINELNVVKGTSRINYSLVENLAASPATKRGIYQALKVVEELVKYMGYNPSNIIIEMARGEEAKQRKDTRKEYLKKIYLAHKREIENYNTLFYELGKKDKIDTEKLFLYFIQLGKSMYSGKPLDINNLSSYEIDHIIPRTLIKDDSLDNKVLVLKEENQEKAANFILPEHFRTSQTYWWEHLKNLNLISSKKFNNLCRSYYSEHDIEGFINRQLVETRQITKHVANILNNFYHDTDIIYLHANLSSNYRDKYELFKYRELNDFHHAHDAYLASVLGIYQKHYLKKSTDFNKLKQLNKKLFEEKKYNDLKYGYVINSIDNEVSNFDKITGEILFDADYFNEVIKNTLYQNDVLTSKKTEINSSSFYKETIVKKDSAKAKNRLKENMDTKLYGGYIETHYSFMKLIEYKKRNKTINALIGIPILLLQSKDKEKQIDNYIKKSFKIESYTIKKDKLPFNLLMNYQNQLVLITGCGVASAEIANETQFILSKQQQIKYKYLLNYVFNNKYPNKEKYLEKHNLQDMSYEEYKIYCYAIFNKEIDDLFDFIIDYMKIRYPLYESISDKLILVKESDEFYNLPLEIDYEDSKKGNISKVIIIKRLFTMLKCNSTNANLEKLKTLKFGKRVGRISGKNITSATIINKSVTGLKVKKYEF